jgi:hypothetical protein
MFVFLQIRTDRSASCPDVFPAETECQLTISGQRTDSPGRIGYASDKLPYNRLSSNIAHSLTRG